MKAIVTAFLVIFIASSLYGQSHFRRGTPTTRYARDEFYIVDSDDDSTLRPTYNFVDTTYTKPSLPWHEVTWWSNPDDASVTMPLSYDSVTLPFFGATAWFLPPPRIDTLTDPLGNKHAVSIPGTSLSTNATLCLVGKDSSPVNLPMEDNTIGTRLVAALWTDWELLSSASQNPTKVYVRPAPDTYLITYYNLGLKGTNGGIRATFQIAANHIDSTITFYYRSFDGSYNGVPAATIIQNVATIGCSDATNSMGATYLHRGYYNATNPNPTYAKNLHNGLAVKFLHRINDAFVLTSITMPPKDHYEIEAASSAFQPSCTIANYSDSTINYSVRLAIVDVSTGSTIYTKIDSFQTTASDVFTYTAPSTGSIRCGNYKLTISFTYRTGKNDAWGEDNTLSRYFSIISGTAAPFREEFDGGISTCYWTNIGAQVVDATSAFITPMPPLSTGSGAKVAVLNRLDASGSPYYLAPTGGDTLISPPIDLGSSNSVYLSFHYQRGLVTDTSKAGVLNRYRSGPEVQVRGIGGGLPTPGDTLIVEGLLKSNSTKFNPPANTWSVLTTIPGGFDVNTQTFITKLSSSYLSDHFRLRFRVKAYNSASAVNYIEDADNWAIDGIHVEPFVSGKTELEPIDVDLGNGPYTHVPRDLSTGLSPKVRLLNRGDGVPLGTGNLHLIILDALGRWVYDKSRTFDFSYPTRDSIFVMPSWDPHGTQGGVMTAIVRLEGLTFDSYTKNDTNIFYKTMYIDDSYAIDDGTMDSSGTKTVGPTEWYWHFTPLTSDTMRNVQMFYPGASGQAANWSLQITGGGLNQSRGLTYSPTAKGWFKSTTTFQKLALQKDTAYTLYFKLNSGPTEAGDGANGLAYYTVVDSSNSANNHYAVVHPEILGNFYYPGIIPYTTPYKIDVDQGGFLLPMVRPVFSGAQNYLPVELAALSADRQPDGSVLVAWKTANELNAARFEVFRGATLVGASQARNNPGGSDYAVSDRSKSELGARYQLFETDLDGSYRQIGQVEVGPLADASRLMLWYPNPASNVLKVEAGEPIAVIQLVDELGRTLRDLHPESPNVEIDVREIPNGSYTLVASVGSKSQVMKITIAH